MKAARTILLSSLLVASSLLAQVPPTSPAPTLAPQEADETLAAYLDRVVGIVPATDAQNRATKEAQAALPKAALDDQVAKDTSTAAASNFAGRVNDTLQSFLPLFQGSIDAVSTSEDGKSLTLRFNPIRGATFGELGLAATVTEPEPYATLLELLPDDSRPGQREAITKGLDDFSDLAYTATYNYVRKLEPHHLEDPRRWYFGRNARLYEELFARFIGDVVAGVVAGSSNPVEEGLWADRFEEGVDLDQLTKSELEEVLEDDYQPFVASRLRDRRILADPKSLVRERAELFGELVANQPQITFSATYRDRDPLVGPRESKANLSIEMPTEPNLNELLRSWKATGGWERAVTDLEARAEEIERGTKWTLAVTYTDRDAYHQTYQPTTPETAPVTLDRPAAHELTGKLQYSRRATWQERRVDDKVVSPMLHLSAEYVDVSDDPSRSSRWLATLTYEIPTGGGTVLPISIVYASKGEFATEPDQRLSAHLGLSLNALTGTKKESK